MINIRFFGEMVVEACVENGAHHIDLSGEPGYLEKMQLNYHAKVVVCLYFIPKHYTCVMGIYAIFLGGVLHIETSPQTNLFLLACFMLIFGKVK